MSKAHSSLTNSQESGKSPSQLNNLTDTELCQTFIDHHCSGRPDLAKPYLAELIERYDKLAPPAGSPAANGNYFAALSKLAQRLQRRGG